jgi:uncharacterized metal-binding protein YceD (DUF177 family)
VSTVSKLKFDVQAIKENQGLCAEIVLDSCEVFSDAAKGAAPAEKISISAEFSVGGETVLLQTKISGGWKMECSRCLKEHTASYEISSEDTFAAAEQTIDLTEHVRESAVIEIPLRSLCKPECLGLCSACGTDLNEKKCDCASRTARDIPPDAKKSPFDALKKLK